MWRRCGATNVMIHVYRQLCLLLYPRKVTAISPFYSDWHVAIKDTCHSVILSCCNFVFWKINLIYLSAGDKDVTESILPRDIFPGRIRLIRAVNSEQHQYQYPKIFCLATHFLRDKDISGQYWGWRVSRKEHYLPRGLLSAIGIRSAHRLFFFCEEQTREWGLFHF